MRFTWNPRKAKSNAAKHGVTFEEAISVFADPLAVMVEDPRHPERSHLVGESGMRRVLVTVFVEMSEDHVHIINARRATTHERRRYEEGETT